MTLSWNLIWFLLYQITLIKLMMQALITILHWGVHPRFKIDQISWGELKFKCMLRIDANQFHSWTTNEHSKNKWKAFSEDDWQEEHIEGKLQPLSVKLSSVGNLLCMSLQVINDFEGGMSAHQASFAHWMFWLGPYLNLKASFKVRSPDVLPFQQDFYFHKFRPFNIIYIIIKRFLFSKIFYWTFKYNKSYVFKF